MFNQYPYLNFNDLNLDWLISQIKKLRHDVDDFVTMNAIKYANPIDWNITKQYEKNTVVIDAFTGVAYLSVAPVPAGINITRTDYWTVIFDLSQFIQAGVKNLANSYESALTYTATMPTDKDNWIVWNGTLYKALNDIHVGDAYVSGGNIEPTTVESFLKAVIDALNAEIEARTEADTALDERITHEVEDRTTADTALDARITQEVADRIAADTALGGRITQEVADRTTADTALDGRITQEVADRTAADTALGGRITQEVEDRTAADTALGGRIEVIERQITVLDNYERDYFQNKHFLIIGDSLSDMTTQAPNWVAHFKTLVEGYGGTVNADYCLNGASFQSIYDNQMSDLDLLTNSYDVIIIELGLNDYHMQFGLKDYKSTTVHNTESALNGIDSLAAENLILAKLRERCPKALMYYCPPTRERYTLQNTFITPICYYRNSFSRAAMYYGCRIIDLSAMPMFAPAAIGDLNGYTSPSDSVHPSPAYSGIMCDFIKRELIAGGQSTWKNSGSKWGRTMTMISEDFVIYNAYSDGTLRLFTGATINMSQASTFFLQNVPYWFPEYPFLGIMNDVPCKIQKQGTNLIVWKPSGVNTGTTLFFDVTWKLPIGVDYGNVLD